MLVTVMIITAVGLLFGAGALLLFRYQCQMRIDRQHELEKVYAVRSALNYFRTYGKDDIGESGKLFTYHTSSDRDLGVVVKPVAAIFPDTNNVSHFNMSNSDHFLVPYLKNYNSRLDYEFGASFTVTNWNSELSALDLSGTRPCIAFINSKTNDNVRWWVNIGMRGTGGWLQEDYGRRYHFQPHSYVGSDVGYTKDVIRLCIIRNITNESNSVGCRHGWPLSQNGERALVFQIWPQEGAVISGDAKKTEMSLYEYECIGDTVVANRLLCMTNVPSVWRSGLQIAGDKVSMFYIDNKASGETSRTGAYFFSECKSMSKAMYDYFSKEIFVGGKSYCGVYTNEVDGRVCSPELRAVFEVEAASSMRDEKNIADSQRDEVGAFMVTPAYQYEILLVHPSTVTNRATVAQKIGGHVRESTTVPVPAYNNTMISYDTHGTEHKGFRQDEREFERSGGK